MDKVAWEALGCRQRGRKGTWCVEEREKVIARVGSSVHGCRKRPVTLSWATAMREMVHIVWRTSPHSLSGDTSIKSDEKEGDRHDVLLSPFNDKNHCAIGWPATLKYLYYHVDTFIVRHQIWNELCRRQSHSLGVDKELYR